MPDSDSACAYIQSFLSRNLGMAGEHCTIPNNMIMTSQIQSACPKTCCQCQGKLRCQYFTEPQTPPQTAGSKRELLGRNAAAGLLPPINQEIKRFEEDHFMMQKTINNKQLKMFMETFQTNSQWWKTPSHY